MKLLIFLLAVVACSLSASVPFDPTNDEVHLFATSDADVEEAGSRIIRGHEAKPNQIPYQVGIKVAFHHSGVLRCGGSLITTGWVLTAASCTIRSDAVYTLRIGSVNMHSGGVSQISTRIVSHSNYNAQNRNNDISLLNIPSPVTLSDAIRLVRLPTAGQMSNTFAGATVRASGWGATVWTGRQPDFLRWVTLRVVSNERCAYYHPRRVIDSVICATGTIDISAGVCTGDIGGPLVLYEDDVPTLIGVVSFHEESGCSSRQPHGFTRTTHFLTWIFERTGLAIRYR